MFVAIGLKSARSFSDRRYREAHKGDASLFQGLLNRFNLFEFVVHKEDQRRCIVEVFEKDFQEIALRDMLAKMIPLKK